MSRLLLFFTLAAMFSCSKAESAADPVISEAEQTYQLCNQNATAETKRLFALLSDLYGKRILSGTVANVDWNTRDAENVYKWTGRWPAINVFDFINIHASRDVNPKGVARLLGRHLRAPVARGRRHRRLHVALAGLCQRRCEPDLFARHEAR